MPPDARAGGSEGDHPQRVHGRRQGRPLRPGQQNLIDTLLPRLRLRPELLAGKPVAAFFPDRPARIWLEIGFGGGEHLTAQAQANPSVGLIGCEVFRNGIATCLAQLAAGGIENVRLVVEDARSFVAALADASIDRAFVLFPDPWPKARHHKRRIVSPAFLGELARILTDGAELRLATDDVAYLRAMLALACGDPAFEWLARRPEDWRLRPADWPQTRYEAKAILAGRRPVFLRLRRRARGLDPRVARDAEAAVAALPATS